MRFIGYKFTKKNGRVGGYKKWLTSKSFKGIFNGCVGAIDGFFQETTCPTKKESGGNVTSFFSGHYESYGLNCQAVCDSNLKFIFFGVVAPGKTNDNVAFPRCDTLYQTIANK